MPTTPDPTDDPAITGVPPETPDDVRPSATGLVAGPVDDETDVHVAEVAVDDAGDAVSAALDQTLEDAEGGIEGSTLDAPEDT
jgi:hypothetical protein